MSGDRVLHCWEDFRDFTDNWGQPGATCLLPDGHDGPHEWTPDSDITVRFADSWDDDEDDEFDDQEDRW